VEAYELPHKDPQGAKQQVCARVLVAETLIALARKQPNKSKATVKLLLNDYTRPVSAISIGAKSGPTALTLPSIFLETYKRGDIVSINAYRAFRTGEGNRLNEAKSVQQLASDSTLSNDLEKTQ
jgi:hypothetical protein